MLNDCSQAVPVSPLLAVCGTLKPAPGRKGSSACRELLRLALAPVATIYPLIQSLDLREAQLPFFDGREPSEYDHPGLIAARAAVETAGGYVFSVPAYWGGIGSAFKNFIEAVCGPGYEVKRSPFAGKPVAILIVGSEPRTAQTAAVQIKEVVDALELALIEPPIIVNDPSVLEDANRAVQKLTAAAATVVLALSRALAISTPTEQ